MSLPPGPPIPGVLLTAAIIASPGEVLWRIADRYGDIFTIQTVPFGTEVIISQPASIKQVLTGDSDTYGAAEANEPLAYVLGSRSLLLLDGPPHQRLRKLMLPPFHGDRMQPLFTTMREATLRAFKGARSGDEMSLQAVLQKITLDIILTTVLGLPSDAGSSPLGDALTVMVNQAQSPLALLWMSPRVNKIEVPFPTPWARVKALCERADALLFEHVRARREGREEGKKRDLLDMLLDARDEDGAPMSDKELRDQLVTLLLAGHETTATSLAWAFEEILHQPGEAERIAAEVRDVTGGAELTAEHASKLPRMDSLVKEVLRLYPVTGAVGRKLKKPATVQGYDLPAGVMMSPNFSLLHRREELYPNPHAFEPERFIGKKVDPYEWMPFGAGAHRCLGMHFALYEMKVVLASILSHYELAPLRKKGTVGLRGFVVSPRGGTRARMVRELS